MATAAPEITAPVESVTVPDTFEENCADAVAEQKPIDEMRATENQKWRTKREKRRRNALEGDRNGDKLETRGATKAGAAHIVCESDDR
jgi:hypothetical protein